MSRCSVPVGADHRELVVGPGRRRPAGVDRCRSRRCPCGRAAARRSRHRRAAPLSDRRHVRRRRRRSRLARGRWRARRGRSGTRRPPPARRRTTSASGAHACGPACPNAARKPVTVADARRRRRARAAATNGASEPGVLEGHEHDAVPGRRRRSSRRLRRSCTPSACRRARACPPSAAATATALVLRVRRRDDDRVDVVARDRVLPAVHDLAGAPRVAGRLRGRARPAREHRDVGTRRRAAPAGGCGAPRCRSRRPRTEPSRQSVLLGDLAHRVRHVARSRARSTPTPTGTMTDRADERLGAAGTSPVRTSRSVGCSAHAHGRPCPTRCGARAPPGSGTRAARGTSARTGRPRRAARRRTRLAVAASGRNHVMLDAAVAVGIGEAAPHQTVDSPIAVEDRAPCSPACAAGSRAAARAARRRPRRRARPCAGSRPRTAR